MLNLNIKQPFLGIPLWNLITMSLAEVPSDAIFENNFLNNYLQYNASEKISYYENDYFYYWLNTEPILGKQGLMTIKPQERLDIGDACIYLSSEIFGENLEGIDSLSISFQPNKNEAVFYRKLLLTPEAATKKLSVNYNHFSPNSIDECYLPDNLEFGIIRDCSRESIRIYIEQVLKPERPDFQSLEKYFQKTKELY